MMNDKRFAEKKPLVSVVVPIYNVQDYLNECIDSILNQTYKNIEVILVDDGSKDNCPQICDSYKDIDSRIKVIHKINGGLSDARNTGLENAIGEYICFIDSDDYIDKDYVKNLISIIISDKCDIAICSFCKTNKSALYLESNENHVKFYDGKNIINLIYGNEYLNVIVAWNKLYKRSLFGNVRYPVGVIHEDEATTCKLLCKAKKVALTDRKMYYYRIRESSITNSSITVSKMQAKLDALSMRREFFRQEELMDYYSKDTLVYLKQVSRNCYASKTFDSKYMIMMKEEFRKTYAIADRHAWNLINRIIMFVSFLNPLIYGKIR